jgi:hypothetical protein
LTSARSHYLAEADVPAIVELRLRAERVLEPTTKQLHGLACALFEGTDSANHVGHEKPFSVWPLTPVPDGWLFRAAWLAAGFPRTVLASCGQLRLGPVKCAVTDMALRPASHAELADGSVVDTADVVFRSPTYFSQNGAHVVVPEPRLIVGSWRRRWNASLFQDEELMIGEELWRHLHPALTLTRYKLGTASRDSGHGRTRAGFAGTATLRLARDAPADVLHAFGALVRFADFCGTGAQTTHGFGATSKSSSTEDRHPYDNTPKARAVADAR